MAPAAYNLCILTIKDRPAEALSWCRKAAELHPQEPKYAYTLAFYQKEQKDLPGAEVLRKASWPTAPALWMAIFCWPRFTCSKERGPRPKRCSARFSSGKICHPEIEPGWRQRCRT